MKQNKKRGLLATVGAFVAASALLIGGSVAANAAPFPIPETSDITITKWSQPVTPGSNATGTAVSTLPTGAEPISGVVFTAYQVPILATAGTNAWQQEIADMNVGDALTALGASFTNAVATHAFPATGLNGVTTWADAPRGLYYVVEDATNASTSAAESAPFLIAVPMTDPDDRNAWLDHIYVYPKNSKIDAEKSVDDSGAIQTGDNFTWSVTSDVPRIEENGSLIEAESFVITDTLDSRLTYDSAVVEIIDDLGDTVSTLVSGASADYLASESNGTVTVTFNASGLTKLLTAAGVDGQRVKVTLTTSVNDATPDATEGTAIINNATVVTNVGLPNEVTATTNDAQTNWGLISFTKENATGALEGAIFDLYSSEADSISDTATPLLTAQTSAANGSVSFNGVRTSDRLNGELITDIADYQVYWLRETVAPADHQLLAEPIPVVLMTDGKIYNVTVDGSGVVTAVGAELTKVVNVQNAPGFVLPLTGGMGTAFLTIIGAGILGFVVVAARRRRSAEAQA